MEEPLLTCEGLAVGHGGRTVASGIGFALRSGEALGVIGENGAGKSTLLRTLLGLQPALSGKIRFGAALSHGDIGYLPQQNPVQRDFPATAREVALFGSTSILTLSPADMRLCAILSLGVALFFALFRHRVFEVVFDPDFARASGTRTAFWETLLAVVYPRDFPAVGTAIVVQGVFDTYLERGERYVHVRDAHLSVR